MTHTNTFHRFTAELLCFIMVLTMTMTVMPITAGAATYGLLTYEIKDNRVTIIGCSELATSVVQIPNQIEGFPVTAIGDAAFIHCISVNEVIIPYGITSIGCHAFSGCSNLTSVSIPTGVTAIELSAFERCGRLTSVTIPNGVKSIGINAFENCTALTSADIPGSVTSIGEFSFKDCRSLKDLTISSGVKSIGGNAFEGCAALTDLTIPNSVTSIGMNAFRDCGNLSIVTISNGVTTIGASAFADCSKLTSVIIPSSVTFIGNDAFHKATANISGGTMTVRSPYAADLTGGSVKILDSADVLVREMKATRNGWDYNYRRLVAVQLKLPNGNAPSWPDVTELLDKNGNSISYGTDRMTTDDNGMLYIWLPENATLKTITAGGKSFVCDAGYVTVNSSIAEQYTFTTLQNSIDINVYFTDGTTPLAPPSGGWQVKAGSGSEILQYKKNGEYNFYVTDYNDFTKAITTAPAGRHALFYTLPDGYSIKGIYSNLMPTGELYTPNFTYNGSFGATPSLYYFGTSNSDTTINIFVGQDGCDTVSPTIPESALPDGTAGRAYEYMLLPAYTSGTAPTLEIDGNLPEGMNLSLKKDKVYGIFDRYYIDGIPIEGGDFTFDIILKRNGSEISRKTLTLNVDGTLPPVTVSGTCQSFGSNESEKTYVNLFKGDSSEPLKVIELLGSGSKPYCFTDVLPGEYTVKIVKEAHVTSTYTFWVLGTPVDQDVGAYLLGDADNDGAVDVLDCMLAERAYSANYTPDAHQLQYLDFNSTSVVDVADYQSIVNIALGIAAE